MSIQLLSQIQIILICVLPLFTIGSLAYFINKL